MRQTEAQSVQNISKHMKELFASFYNAGNYDEAVRYLKTLRTIPTQVLDYIRSLNNPELFEKVGCMIILQARVKGPYFDCIGTALEFLDLAINSDDSKVNKYRCWTTLADAYCRPELGVLDIRKAIDCYIKMIPFYSKEDIISPAFAMRNGLFRYLTTNTDEQGVRYAMERIIKMAKRALNVAWIEFLQFLARWQFGNIRERNIFNMSVSEIFNLRIPGLTKDGNINLEGFMNGRRWLSPFSLHEAVPYDAEAERIVCEAALNGDEDCAWIMVKHYHTTEQYGKVLEMSRLVSEHHHGYDEILRLLASMYKNGQGVEQNLEKARGLYMECVERNRYRIHENSDYYNLGEIHRIMYERDGKTDDLMKARRYYKAIISPIGEVHDYESYRKYGTAFRELYRYSSSDTLSMTVKVEKGEECAFYLKVIPVTCLAVDWGEKDGGLEHILIHIGLFLSRTEKVSLKHQYKKEGVYVIKIVTEGAYSVDGIQYPETRRQLLSVDTLRCPALKTFVACGQMLETLDFSKNKYLHGVICRDNWLKKLDLRQCPTITHLDCSQNPELKDLLYDERSALTVLCAHNNTNLSEENILSIYNDVLVKNRGTLERHRELYVFDLQEVYMRLEYYVRCSQCDRLVLYLKKGLKYFKSLEDEEFSFSLSLDELKRAFQALKALKVSDYDFPYKSGYLKVMDTYVSVEDLCNEHHICAEEFFITEHPWTECMSIPVRYGYYREPWMRFKPIEPEYIVACCLLNMIFNGEEKEKYIKE